MLARYNAADWSALPPNAGEYGEIVIILEEFLALVEKADEVAEIAKMNRDMDKSKEMKLIISQLWFRLSSLVSQARKTGIFLVVALTDVTNDAIGKQASKLKRQMARVVYRMNSAPSSRSLLDIERGSDFANGTVGLPTGEFLVNIEGQVRHGVSFYPQEKKTSTIILSHARYGRRHYPILCWMPFKQNLVSGQRPYRMPLDACHSLLLVKSLHQLINRGSQ